MTDLERLENSLLHRLKAFSSEKEGFWPELVELLKQQNQKLRDIIQMQKEGLLLAELDSVIWKARGDAHYASLVESNRPGSAPREIFADAACFEAEFQVLMEETAE